MDAEFIYRLAFSGNRPRIVVIELGAHPSSAAALDALESSPTDRRPVTSPGEVVLLLGNDLPPNLAARAHRIAANEDFLNAHTASEGGDPDLLVKAALARKLPPGVEGRAADVEASAGFEVRVGTSEFVHLDCTPTRRTASSVCVVLAAAERPTSAEQLGTYLIGRLPADMAAHVVVAPESELARRWEAFRSEIMMQTPGIGIAVIAPPGSERAVLQALRSTPLDRLPLILSHANMPGRKSTGDELPPWLPVQQFLADKQRWITQSHLETVDAAMTRGARLLASLRGGRRNYGAVADPELRALLATLRADVFTPPGYSEPLARADGGLNPGFSPWLSVAAARDEQDAVCGFTLTRAGAPALSRLCRIVLDTTEGGSLGERSERSNSSFAVHSVYGSVPAELIASLVTSGQRPQVVEIEIRDHSSLLAAVEAASLIRSAQGPEGTLSYTLSGERTNRLKAAAEFLVARGLLGQQASAAPPSPAATAPNVPRRRVTRRRAQLPGHRPGADEPTPRGPAAQR
ncbi:MAG: hypothetical protein ACR2JX_05265 [Mycobacteriales bacterium]